MCISSRNSLTDRPCITYNQILGHPCGLIKLTRTKNHHRLYPRKVLLMSLPNLEIMPLAFIGVHLGRHFGNDWDQGFLRVECKIDVLGAVELGSWFLEERIVHKGGLMKPWQDVYLICTLSCVVLFVSVLFFLSQGPPSQWADRKIILCLVCILSFIRIVSY